ncbi:epimerase [Mycobacterium saskatchewanense]|uniref:Epimerase n=1 Tax=Mycobacterium saskatchewanense TaxID=220927 RepID=A0AAJ3NSV1_9MYCO|nr:hypothetical protein [Mycobacterium saskatchewanense]ORW72923.1 hypothetical protein AWC23_08695 [Mycobacterium saskatchewanense]BBX62548.1 epimerase [Mycobacterium saskatchewanense]
MTHSLTALVIGGTGPTGPFVIAGLLQRGYRVTMLNRGHHETGAVPNSVERIYADAFSADQLCSALSDRTFDLALVMYGRTRDTVRLLQGRVGKLVTVGGNPVYLGHGTPAARDPAGLPVPAREGDQLADSEPGPQTNTKIARMVLTEKTIFECHPTATHFRYPTIYGPRQVMPREWMVLRRLLDGRRHIILPDGGLTLRTVAYSENAASALIAAVDRSELAAGQTYNVCDDWTPTLRQFVEILSAAVGREIEIIDMPFDLATPAWPLMLYADPFHRLTPHDKAFYQLGHVNPVSVHEGYARTARWLLDNPPENAAYISRSGDPFDYEAEDRLISAWQSARRGLAPFAQQASTGYVDRYNAAFDAGEGGPREWVLLPRQ